MGIKFLLLLVVSILLVHENDGALAAMSIDLGSQFIKIGLVKPGVPMEIVLNKESRRKTPNLLGIRNNERYFADAAAMLATKYPNSVYQYLINILAKQSGDPSIELYKQNFPFATFTYDEDRKTVQFAVESESHNVETLLAMILWSAKTTTEAFAGQSVKDVVITVPIFFNQAERRALAAAANIAGLNLLQLLSDGSAAALNYGVFRRKEITEQPQTMMIYDIGASKTTATIVEYVLEAEKNSKDKNPVVRTIGIGYDRLLGGFEISQRLAKYLEKTFRETVKTPTDIATNARSMAKLQKEAERVKAVLSANKDTFAQIENVHEEQNFRTQVTRDQLEEMMKDLEPRFLQPIHDALKMAEKNIGEIDQFVLLGGGTRIPRIQEMLKSVLGEKEIGRFLNTDEAIALGAVYQAAHLSKSFRVLPFAVQELVVYPVQVNFKTKTEEGELKDVARTLFGYKTHYPCAKKIVSFQSYSSDFEVQLNYGSLAHLSEDQIRQFGSFNLSTVSLKGVEDAIKTGVKDDNSENKGIKTSFAIDLSGIISVAKSELAVDQKPSAEELTTYDEALKIYEEELKIEEEKEKVRKEEEKRKKAEQKKADKEAKEKDGEGKTTDDQKEEEPEKNEDVVTPEDNGNTEETTTEEAKSDEEKPKDEEKKEEKKKLVKPVQPKTKTDKFPLQVTVERKDLLDLTEEKVEASKKVLGDYQRVEKEKHDREAAMNALEGMVYDLAVKIEDGEEFAEFLTTEEKTKIAEELTKRRAWLEDDMSFETPTEEFIAHKKTLDDLTAAGEFRKKETLMMPKAIEALNNLFNHSNVFYETAINMTGTEDPVFTETELEVLKKLITTTDEWWNEKKAELEKQKKNEDPLVTTHDVAEKLRDLDREVNYLLNKLKNYVPKKKVKKTNAKNDTTTESEQTDKDSATTEETTTEEPTTEKQATPKTEDNEHDPSEL